MKRLRVSIGVALLILLIVLPTSIVDVEGKKKVKHSGINIEIDEDLFNSNVCRLNKEIYDIADQVITEEHFERCYKDSESPLFMSYRKLLNPLVPLALSVNECGGRADRRYTWTPAIYSRQIMSCGQEVDLDNLHIAEVNSDTYVVLGLQKYLQCGNNCTAHQTIGDMHYHVGNGLNDNDSLGPMQILRRYVEATNGITYTCGESTLDLMCWKDNIQYFFHKQGDAFSWNKWNANYEIKNIYELVALVGVGHNTGQGFQFCDSASSSGFSLWQNASSVYDFCRAITSKESLKVLREYVDDWYSRNLGRMQNNQDFGLAGQLSWNGAEVNRLLQNMGVCVESYTKCEHNHKQIYPLLAVLNYMSLEKLYGVRES